MRLSCRPPFPQHFSPELPRQCQGHYRGSPMCVWQCRVIKVSAPKPSQQGLNPKSAVRGEVAYTRASVSPPLRETTVPAEHLTQNIGERSSQTYPLALVVSRRAPGRGQSPRAGHTETVRASQSILLTSSPAASSSPAMASQKRTVRDFHWSRIVTSGSTTAEQSPFSGDIWR